MREDGRVDARMVLAVAALIASISLAVIAWAQVRNSEHERPSGAATDTTIPAQRTSTSAASTSVPDTTTTSPPSTAPLTLASTTTYAPPPTAPLTTMAVLLVTDADRLNSVLDDACHAEVGARARDESYGPFVEYFHGLEIEEQQKAQRGQVHFVPDPYSQAVAWIRMADDRCY